MLYCHLSSDRGDSYRDCLPTLHKEPTKSIIGQEYSLLLAFNTFFDSCGFYTVDFIVSRSGTIVLLLFNLIP